MGKGRNEGKKDKRARAKRSERPEPSEAGKDPAKAVAPKEPQPPQGPTVLAKATKVSKWIVHKTIEVLAIAATLISLHQVLLEEPRIQPFNIGSSELFPMTFLIHNPLFVTMHDTVMAGQLGKLQYGPVERPPDLREPFKSASRPCEKLLSYPNLITNDLLVDRKSYGNILAGHDATFTANPMRFVGKGAGAFNRAVYGVAVLYKVELFGMGNH